MSFCRVLLVLSLAACSTRHVIPTRPGMAWQANNQDAFDAGSARVSPGSEVRFCHITQGCSDWVSAADLRVDERGAWIDKDAGYLWADMARVEVKRFDGVKTAFAILGTAAAVVIVVPILLAAGALRNVPTGGGPRERSYPEAKAAVAVGAIALEAATTPEPADTDAYWPASARPIKLAPRLFTTAARVRDVITAGAFADADASYSSGYATTTALARLRLGNFLEGGAGMRFAYAKDDRGTWRDSKLRVIQGGFHAPFTARLAMPIALDVAWGTGDIDRDVRIVWGLRYTSRSGRFNVTLRPATFGWTRTQRNHTKEWKYATTGGIEVGFTL